MCFDSVEAVLGTEHGRLSPQRHALATGLGLGLGLGLGHWASGHEALPMDDTALSFRVKTVQPLLWLVLHSCNARHCDPCCGWSYIPVMQDDMTLAVADLVFV